MKRIVLFVAIFLSLLACQPKVESRPIDPYLGQVIFSAEKSEKGDFHLISMPNISTSNGIILETGKVYDERFEFLGCSSIEGKDTKYPYFAFFGNFYSPGPGYNEDLVTNPVGVVFRETTGTYFVGTGVVSFEAPISYTSFDEATGLTKNEIYFLPKKCKFSK